MDFKTAKDRLGDWLGTNKVRFADAVRGDLINLARRELTRLHDLRFNEKSDTFVTVASTRDYSLPTGWSRPHTLWYLHPTTSAVVFLELMSKERFDLFFPDSTKTALPEAYTVWAGQMQLAKTPDQVITINRNYYRILPDLSADADTDDLMNEAWEVVHFKALKEASGYLIEDARVPMWKEKADELEAKLIIEHGRSRTAGRRSQSQEPG